jgi:hypothetical protein
VEQRSEIDQEILDALVEATPESWSSATLSAEFEFGPESDSVSISITNPDGRREIVEPTERLQTAVRRLSLLMKSLGHSPRSAVYKASEVTPGEWRVRASFEYGHEK